MVNERYKFTTIWSPFSFRGNARKGVRAEQRASPSERTAGGRSDDECWLIQKKKSSCEGLVNFLKTK
jgi:hypothetical protein